MQVVVRSAVQGYREKPVIIEAILHTGTARNKVEIMKFTDAQREFRLREGLVLNFPASGECLSVPQGYYVIKWPNGCFSTCSYNDFVKASFVPLIEKVQKPLDEAVRKFKNRSASPKIIDAIQYTGTEDNARKIMTFTGISVQAAQEEKPAETILLTPPGKLDLVKGDYVVREVDGQISFCREKLFTAKYEPVEQERESLTVVAAQTKLLKEAQAGDRVRAGSRGAGSLKEYVRE